MSALLQGETGTSGEAGKFGERVKAHLISICDLVPSTSAAPSFSVLWGFPRLCSPQSHLTQNGPRASRITRLFLLRQGQPGFFGSVGPTGTTGEKVAKFCVLIL